MDTKPLTLAEAKRMVREQLGRLPRCGYETKVVTREEHRTVTLSWSGQVISGPAEVEYWLANEAGRYRLHNYCNGPWKRSY